MDEHTTDHRTAARPRTDTAPLLHTPAEAADILKVKESWLRRQAGQRRIPSTRLGKHLRFSDADLRTIVDGARRSVRTRSRAPRHHRDNTTPEHQA